MKRIDLKELEAPFNTFVSCGSTAKIHWLPFSNVGGDPLDLVTPWSFKPFNLSRQERES